MHLIWFCVICFFNNFSNKAHHGYLGDSIIGKWCNLGAGTSTSNVKNNGSDVMLQLANAELNAGNKFISGDHTKDHEKPGQYAGLVYPWLVTDKYIYSQRWYITNGLVVIGSAQYALATGGFMQWLFIDDGAGNVINTEGVLYRCDALTCGIFSYASLIPKDNFVDGGENIMVRNTEYKYSYPGCRESVTSNRVYCGDF